MGAKRATNGRDPSKKDVHWRGVPIALIEKIDAFAAQAAGKGARASRNRALEEIVRRGLEER